MANALSCTGGRAARGLTMQRVAAARVGVWQCCGGELLGVGRKIDGEVSNEVSSGYNSGGLWRLEAAIGGEPATVTQECNEVAKTKETQAAMKVD